jgi:glycerol kinase
MSKLIAAIDQGTTSTRCILFNKEGQTISKAQLEHTQIYPQPGWVEHDPHEIWERTQDVIRNAIQQANINPIQIQAVGITNQRETTVFWDRKTGDVFGNAIVWQDTRTKQICDELAAPDGIDLFREKVGLPLATYFSGPKLKWILENVDGAMAAAQNGNGLFGNIDSWIIWWLTGGLEGGSHVTDVTNASRTMLMNLETLDWDDEILQILGIPRQVLPRIVPSSDSLTWGLTSPEGSFQASIPVCGDLGDQQAALVGQACFRPGEAKNTYGTGCFLLLNTGNEIIHSQSGMLTTLA